MPVPLADGRIAGDAVFDRRFGERKRLARAVVQPQSIGHQPIVADIDIDIEITVKVTGAGAVRFAGVCLPDSGKLLASVVSIDAGRAAEIATINVDVAVPVPVAETKPM